MKNFYKFFLKIGEIGYFFKNLDEAKEAAEAMIIEYDSEKRIISGVDFRLIDPEKYWDCIPEGGPDYTAE